VKRILLIDDNPTAQEMLSRMVPRFSDGPWELDWADTYDSGLQKLVAGGYAVCLLVYRLDEGKDGLALLRAAREAGNTPPTIFLTAETDPALDEAALQAGAMDFLVKAEFTPRNVQTADERSKLVYRVRISVDNQDGVLKLGMPVEAELPLQPVSPS